MLLKIFPIPQVIFHFHWCKNLKDFSPSLNCIARPGYDLTIVLKKKFVVKSIFKNNQANFMPTRLATQYQGNTFKELQCYVWSFADLLLAGTLPMGTSIHNFKFRFWTIFLHSGT